MNVMLVIAEDEAVRQALRVSLPETDLVLFEPGVDAAARRLVSLQADAILVDDSPSLGVHVIPALRATTPGTRIIALTARNDLLTHAGLTKAGADVVLLKPFSCDELNRVVAGELAPAAVASNANSPAAGNGTSMLAAMPVGGAVALNQHQMALRWLSRISVAAGDPARLSQSLVELALDIFDAVRCAVILDAGETVSVAASHGLPPEVPASARFTYTDGIMRCFEERASLLDRYTAHDFPAALKQMQMLSAEIVAPLLRNGRVFGAIALGEKASGVPYTQEERELLTLVARSASVAFEQAGARAATSREQQTLEDALTQLHAAVVLVDADRNVRFMNSQAESILEINAIDAVGRSIQKLGSQFADPVLRTLKDGRPRTGIEIRDPGRRMRVQLSVTLARDGAVIISFSRMEEESVSTENIAYSPFWEYLSSRVAQEVKNPMVAINTFAQLLPRKYDSEEFRDAFSRVVQKEVERINQVVDTLFDFARNPKFNFEEADLNTTVSDVLKTFEELLASRQISLDTNLAIDDVTAEVDLRYFTQALHNVVQNAIEAMPVGGTLSISTRQNSEGSEIRVMDTGEGVSAEDENMIFLPFYSTKEKGMGLGLPLANRIVQQHKGAIELGESPEKGASFTIRLPIKETDHADHSSSR